jgi:hypothetical protein
MSRYFRRHNIFYIKKHKYQFNEDFFAQDTPESFYLAGFLAADGNVSDKKNAICISISDKDRLFLEDIQKLICYQGKIHIYKILNSKRNSNWKDTNTIVNDLKKFNIVPRKTKIYNFPEWLIDHPFVSHYMRGYMDGDGHLGIRYDKKLRFSLAGNLFFLKKYQQILENNCGINHNKIQIRANGLSILEYAGNIIVPKICSFLYNNSTLCLKRKYNIYAPYKICQK